MLLVIKGKVDDWRLQRQAAWCIVCGFVGSKDMPESYQLYSLPFDDELMKKEKEVQDESLQEWYNLASIESANFIWPSNN